MKFNSDIDIDVGNREQVLQLLKHHPAGIIRNGELIKHNTGIYVTDIPVDPFTGTASIDYKSAEERGYIKLDFLNVSVYTQIRDEQHLQQLMMAEPIWELLYEREICEQLIHINGHYDTLLKMPERVNTIPRLAMFLAIIRPAKRHLIGQPWGEVAKTIWERPVDGSYWYKKSHSCAYAHLIALHLNLLCERLLAESGNLTNQGN